ncbi:MAG: hypothetical protein OXL96_28155 [Candidatus Poribacteria bacterium]|nr:hypothetical protein [Candidatus Poribacteria bacterium]
MLTTANLRISYIGGGYDYPEFFRDEQVIILSEGLPVQVQYNSENGVVSPVKEFSGLGASAARYLAILRYYSRYADFKTLVNLAIKRDVRQKGGWQDAIAAAHDGFIKITLYQDDWSVEPIATELAQFRRLYEIPVCREPKNILSEMVCRESSFKTMQVLVNEGESALQNADFQTFGLMVTAAWNLKKQWHPEISNPVIEQMQTYAQDTEAWGWKVCGAGGQGYFLVIGDEQCHSQMSRRYECFEVDDPFIN